MNLETLLHQTFGFAQFRANQEAVCRAATDGRDVLLVMPTGAGKSLCYQLPAIARGGTALVISPLIALMDDQATKLTAAGLRVARIHSGLSRDEARQACRDYLDGTLQFLFIAPERMRVPNFPEMLARRKPSLIAIDEAHCISAWGHDFRPDYRTLGDFLPALRPAPVIALTATATPTVQRDIITQLKLTKPDLFIHGFRRHNLAIEVVELSKPRRNEFTANLLKEKSNRPAIVYAPSRKAAEDLASTLGGSAAAYHAGLDPATRERVQRRFLSGNLEVVVATIAFGMGIDKADVRTVVHTALPGSVEQYYQEIGRAGRDGQPSRTVLLHSFADRKMHDFFLERDYPAITELTRVEAVLTEDYQMPDLLRQRLKMDAETFDKAVEKLIAQGAANIDMAGNVRAAEDAPRQTAWRKGYDEQINFRRSQIDRMVQFAESAQCRMAALIQHFGDIADGLRPCGHCDFCAPQSATAQTFRQPTSEEERQLRAILRALDGQTRTTGKLHTELSTGALRGTPATDRKVFDTLLGALTRAGLITLNQDQWTNPEGNVITFKKASLTHEGRTLSGPLPPDLLLKDASTTTSPSRKKSGISTTTKPSKASLKAERDQTTATYNPAQKTLEANLRNWRKNEAAKTGKPAFIVFSDSVLHNLVVAAPKTISQLLTVSGIGQEKADRYGADIIALCRQIQPSSLTKEQPLAPTMQPNLTNPPTRKLSAVQQTKQNFKLVAENLKPLSMSSAAGRKRSSDYDQSAYRRLDFEDDLRVFAKAQSQTLNQPAAKLLSEAAIAEILRFRPRTLTELERLENLRADLPASFFRSLLAACVAEYNPESTPIKQPNRAQNAVDSVFTREPAKTYVRERTAPEHTDSLTPEQQALDERLRNWRKAESERLGLPLFFVLASTTIRNIVLARPQTLTQLKAVHGLGLEKVEKFGPGIIEVCTT
ncbi:RecQ family ATP-dependent DNA helicase [Tunturiibacter lichenicola]|uniref:RecQ family ATP-dependent DNA helicase n=1 Tax=Tunturiibacter lichenicola TaxID=2051959 RepID=UPI0021B25B02|nr:RecQ family ATP-dependent DNA helicase [Edaphobacter lichenicola]